MDETEHEEKTNKRLCMQRRIRDFDITLSLSLSLSLE